MTTEPTPYPSHSFTLRLWQEELGEGVTEWRGQLRHVSSGQIHYFREWQAFLTLLLTMLADLEAAQGSSSGDSSIPGFSRARGAGDCNQDDSSK